MVHALGGSNSFLSSYEKQLAGNSYSEEIFLNKNGWIKEIDTRKLGLTLIQLGGGRKKVDDNNDKHIGSPLPGQVAKIFVQSGNKVIKGDKLLVIEAMKMETTINADKSGTIKSINVSSGIMSKLKIYF